MDGDRPDMERMGKYVMQVVDIKHSEEENYIHFGHVEQDSPLMLVQFGHQQTRSKYGYGPTIRDHFLLHFVRKGNGVMQANDTEYQIGAGTVFAIYPHQITYYEALKENPWEYFWLGFDGSWASDIMERIGFENGKTVAIHIMQPDKVFGLLEEMERCMEEAEEPNDRILGMMGRMYEILQAVTTQQRDVATVPGKQRTGILGNEYTRILMSIIKTSYSERINVQELADRLNLNRSYLTELFKRDTGMSIKQYLTQYRLEQAMIELQNPERSIKSVAMGCGFDDPLYFSRVFRKRFALSPQEWRAQNVLGGG